MRSFRLALIAVIAFSSLSALQAADEKVTYNDHVLPIFRAKCFSCHNPDKKSSGLDLTNFTAMKAGGSSGEVVEPGDAESSYLWMVVNHDSEPFMPPNSDKMPAEMLNVIKAWIEGGALETKDSKVVIKAKPKLAVSMSFGGNVRPEVAPLPSRLSLQPIVHTERTTAVNSIATSPWAPLVAISGQKQILLYNTQTLELTGVLPFPEGEPQVLKFSRSGQLLLAGGGQGAAAGRVVVFEVKTGNRMFVVGDELDAVLGADISSDNKYVALGGPQKIVRIYSTQTSEKIADIKKHTDWVTALSFSPDGVLLASGDRNGGVFVWEAETGREYLALRGHSKEITGFSWRSDSNVLASASEDTTVRTWEMENGGQLKSWGAHGAGTADVWFTRDNQVATVGRDKTAKLWNQDGAAVRTFEAFPDLALAVAVCDETKRVIAGDWTGIIRVWNATDGARIGELSANPVTLETRVAQATAAFTAAQDDQKAKQDAYNADQAVVQKTTADLGASQKQVADLTALEKTFAPKLAAAQATVADAKAKQEAAAKVVTSLDPLVPALKETVAKADAAAPKAGGDEEVVKALAQIKALTAARETTLAAAKKSATDEAARLQSATQEIVATQKQMTDTKAAIVAAAKQVEQYTAALTAAQQKAVASKGVLDQSTAAASAAQQAIARWSSEIEFTNKLTTFKAQTGEVEKLEIAFLEVNAEAEEMLKKVTAAQAEMVAAQQAEKVAADAFAAAQQNVAKLTGERDAQAKAVATLESAVPMLQQAVEKGAAAAAQLPEDKELAAAAAQLKAALDKTNKDLADSKAKVTEMTAGITTAQAAMKPLEQKMAESKQLVVAATQKIQAEQAAAKPLQDKAAQAKQVFEQASASLDKLRQEVDGLRQQASTTSTAQNAG